jgi:enoyl-CoA hydratase/carnithine racemase
VKYQELCVDREDSVIWLRLSGSPLRHREAAELYSAIAELREDSTMTCVVLSSRNKDFCPATADDFDPGTAGFDLPACLSQVRVPVIAAVRGAVMSAGLEILLAADICLTSPDGQFGMHDLLAGRPPAWGATQRLPRAIGHGRALSVLLLGTILSAEEAQRAGLVSEVVGDPDARAHEIARQLADGPQYALELAKAAMREGLELPLATALRLEADYNHLLHTSSDRAEGLNAFLEKRPPRFGLL